MKHAFLAGRCYLKYHSVAIGASIGSSSIKISVGCLDQIPRWVKTITTDAVNERIDNGFYACRSYLEYRTVASCTAIGGHSIKAAVCSLNYARGTRAVSKAPVH